MHNDIWKPILIRCGVDADSLTGRGRPCPCCEGTDRFTYDNKNGNGDHVCRGCGAGNGFELLKKYHNIEFNEALNMAQEAGLPIVSKAIVNNQVITRSDNLRNKKEMQDVLDKCTKAAGSPAEKYLNKRGLKLPDPISDNVQCLYARDVPQFNETTMTNEMHGCMVWCARSAINIGYNMSENIMIHKTFITPDGDKAMGSSSKIYSKKWIPDNLRPSMYIPLTKSLSDSLIIGEGIENSLAVYEMMKENYNIDCTTIAAFNAGNLAKLCDPALVDRGQPSIPNFMINKNIIICLDHDLSFVGQLAGYTCARNLFKSNQVKSVNVIMTSSHEHDWCDAWQQKLPEINNIEVWK